MNPGTDSRPSFTIFPLVSVYLGSMATSTQPVCGEWESPPLPALPDLHTLDLVESPSTWCLPLSPGWTHKFRKQVLASVTLPLHNAWGVAISLIPQLPTLVTQLGDLQTLGRRRCLLCVQGENMWKVHSSSQKPALATLSFIFPDVLWILNLQPTHWVSHSPISLPLP